MKDTIERGPDEVEIVYTNHRGETAKRRITPRGIWFGATEWHREQQWLLDAYDHDVDGTRSFAVADIHGWEARR